MSADSVDEESQSSTFLDRIEFLTGENPNAGSFLLVVGMITIVFIAAFQFALPAPTSNVLTGFVLVVTVISFIAGAILDRLGHFGTPADDS